MNAAARLPLASAEAPADLESVYVASAGYVWVSLQRLGVRHADLEDLSHDVFLVAHRRFREFSGSVKINSWLFGICLRVAAHYPRRAPFPLERGGGAMAQEDGLMALGPAAARPDQQALQREAERRAQHILDAMDLAKRAVFVMFELEGLSCQDIAGQLGVPVGTVYSRLHAARAFFEKEAQRFDQGEGA